MGGGSVVWRWRRKLEEGMGKRDGGRWEVGEGKGKREDGRGYVEENEDAMWWGGSRGEVEAGR